MSYSVVTHDGKAHMDELIGIALLAYNKNELPTQIQRVDSNEASILVRNKEPNEYFIDCGLIYDPLNGYFDHHQSAELDSAALLVFNHFNQELINTDFHEYIKLLSLIDTKGPIAVSDFKYNSESVKYFSFTQTLLLKQFENEPLLIVELFYKGIKEIIEFESDKKRASIWLSEKGNIRIEIVNGLNVLIYEKNPPVDLYRAIKSIDSSIIESNSIDAIYSYDKEDPSKRVLYRTLIGHNKINFSKSNCTNILFCHVGGFLLKFIPIDSHEWQKIILESKI